MDHGLIHHNGLSAVSCDLQLIANANYTLSCAGELTHMNLLTQSSRSVDNRSLDGFVAAIKENNCGDRDGCEACGYCSTWAERVVKVNEEYRKEQLALGGDLEKGLYSGEVWE